MDTDETKEVAQVEDVLSTEVDPTELEAPATESDGTEATTDTVGEVESETEVDEQPDGEVVEEATTEADDTAVEVSDDEISELEAKLARMERKIELTKKLRERTKELLDLGEVLHNTDEPVVEPEDMEEAVDEIPDISETQYVDVPKINKDEEEE